MPLGSHLHISVLVQKQSCFASFPRCSTFYLHISVLICLFLYLFSYICSSLYTSIVTCIFLYLFAYAYTSRGLASPSLMTLTLLCLQRSSSLLTSCSSSMTAMGTVCWMRLRCQILTTGTIWASCHTTVTSRTWLHLMTWTGMETSH